MIGERVQLIHTSDPYTNIAPGTRGTVTLVDDFGTIHVAWDSGHRLGMIPGQDRFVRIVEPPPRS
jgi:signal recognition particle receptor subunit beta